MSRATAQPKELSFRQGSPPRSCGGHIASSLGFAKPSSAARALACATKPAAILLAGILGRPLVPFTTMRACQSTGNSLTWVNGNSAQIRHQSAVKRALYRNAGSQPPKKCLIVDTQFFGPFFCRLGDAVVGDAECISAVVLLFRLPRPAAVFRTVGSIVIDPLNRMTRGSFAHIQGENFEIQPTFAYPNPPAPIIREGGVVRIKAALLKPRPDIIKRSSAPAMRFHGHNAVWRTTREKSNKTHKFSKRLAPAVSTRGER